MELVNQVHESNLVRWARSRPRVLVLSGDLTASTEIALFKQQLPERFFSMGMAEQNMLSWAGGLAREGFVPFLHTFAVFLYRRPLDQLQMSVCYPNLPVRLVGFLPGVSTPGGVTHQAIDDIAVLRGLPNMTILEVGDATDVETVLDVTEQIPGPAYLRMMRGQIPRLFRADEPMRLNRARVLCRGTDVTILSTGLCTEQAIRAVGAMRQRGVSVEHLHVSTLKPFSDPQVVEAVATRPMRSVTMARAESSVNGSKDVTVWLRFSASSGMLRTARWSAMKKAWKRASSSRRMKRVMWPRLKFASGHAPG